MKANLHYHLELMACNIAITALSHSSFVRALVRSTLTGSFQSKEWLWLVGLLSCGFTGFVLGFCLIIFLI